jgi:hypothetical protein
MIELPEGVEEGEAPDGNLEEPRRVFFFQEKIPGYQNLLSAKTKDYHLTNSSPACDLFLHAFQHWVYTTTKGQLTLTDFKGYPPMISKPNIIDLNPR